MNRQAIGAVGEILGAFAVVVSLVYLATQIRTQNREACRAAMHDIYNGFRESTSPMMDREMAEIVVRGHKEFDALSETETLRLLIGGTNMPRTWEEAYIRHEEGVLDDRMWVTMLSYYGLLLSARGFHGVWQRRKQCFDSKFRAFVNGLELAEYTIK
jgi:hypothetical protein